MNQSYRKFAKLTPKTVVLTICYEDDECGRQVAHKKYSRKQLYQELADDKYFHELDPIRFDEVANFVMDVWEDVVHVDSLEEYQKRKATEKRQELEQAARELAYRHGVQINTMEFIDALQSEIQRTEDYREGMREDGLCIGYGVNREQWFDEYNESKSDTAGYEAIMHWLESQCPLLMAQYHEQKLREKQAVPIG